MSDGTLWAIMSGFLAPTHGAASHRAQCGISKMYLPCSIAWTQRHGSLTRTPIGAYTATHIAGRCCTFSSIQTVLISL